MALQRGITICLNRYQKEEIRFIFLQTYNIQVILLFPCSIPGVLACATAFGGLVAVVPDVGIAAESLACELAFAVGCSIN
ncbi:hypothetical protein [Rummeliibacillus suwonensis]|uniref:hypothetical protein n=1 Tax=Rummeliibacillus suwonensis TaxID=1306154 RepID=UPI001AAEB9C2|nr:hypothetical protein [Rummeliibacillus suwonensis]MBO2537798.1 hypothetical protein [Rummeliibacillus suwonensis]